MKNMDSQPRGRVEREEVIEEEVSSRLRGALRTQGKGRPTGIPVIMIGILFKHPRPQSLLKGLNGKVPAGV